MNAKEEFIQIYKENIHREGSSAFLEFLEGPHSDFFTAPASTRFHGNMEGGLCAHSVHVYHCLKDYLDRQRVKEIYKEYIKLDRDKSTFKSHRDFSSEKEISFKHF